MDIDPAQKIRNGRQSGARNFIYCNTRCYCSQQNVFANKIGKIDTLSDYAPVVGKATSSY